MTSGLRLLLLRLALALAGVCLLACLVASAPATAKSTKLKLSDKSAVPGQVVVLPVRA